MSYDAWPTMLSKTIGWAGLGIIALGYAYQGGQLCLTCWRALWASWRDR